MYNFQDYDECGRQPRPGVNISMMIDELGAKLLQLSGEDVEIEVNIVIKFKYFLKNSYFQGIGVLMMRFPPCFLIFSISLIFR